MSRAVKLIIGIAGLALAVAIAVRGTQVRASFVRGEELLRRSYDAESRYSYLGLRELEVVSGGKWVKASGYVVHQRPDQTRYEVQGPAQWAGLVTIDDGETSYTFSPRSQKWRGRTQPKPDLELALRNYQPRLTGSARRIGRPCWRVETTPRHSSGPSKLIWVDQQTGVALAGEVRNSRGDPLSRWRLTKFHLLGRSAGDRLLFQPPSKAHVEWDVVGAVALPFTPLQPTYLPRGYRYQQARTYVQGGKRVLGLSYSDGMNSILINQRPDTGRRRQPRQWWTSSRFSQVLRRSIGGVRVTVMGDVPVGELNRIADSLTPKPLPPQR